MVVRHVRRSSFLASIAFLFVMPTMASASPGAGSTAPAAVPTASIDCPIAVPQDVAVECGEVVVPEDYDAAGPTLRLPYILLRSRGAGPAPDPLIFTVGGPGLSSLSAVWSFAASPLLDDRDIIVFEQRGNRYATPALVCDPSFWWEETAGKTPCLDAIEAGGIDLSHYTAENIARDVVALREALGYDEWNLYGGSFSTWVMLLVMKADPSGTRAAILESVKPPNETIFAHEADVPLRAIEQLFTDCAADEECAAAYPDLSDDFFRLVRHLNAEPREIEVGTTNGGEPIAVAFDGHDFIDWIVIDQLYRPVFPHYAAAYLPLLIEEVLAGNYRPLEVAARNFWSSMVENPDWALGLLFAINCQEDLPAAGPMRPVADLAASERLDGFARWAGQRVICEAWDLEPVGRAATESVLSDVPALVLAGSYDPVTPPSWSRATADNLSNSTYVEFPGHGHNVTIDNPCAVTLQVRFLADPTAALDTSCVETAQKPRFVLPDDVYRAPGLARSGEEVSLGAPGGVAWIEAVAAVSIYGTVVFGAALMVAGPFWVVRRRRRAQAIDRSAVAAYFLAVMIAVMVIAIPLLTTEVNDAYESRGALAFALGPSRDLVAARALALVSPLAGLVILALGVMTVWAWLAGRWGAVLRVLATATLLCSLGVIVLGVRWGLFTMLV